MRKPTIALVHGFAMGSGLALAAACDLRICTPAARFGLPIARTVGNCLSMENYARLAALLGEARVKDIVFTARPVDADEALAIGLATEVVGGAEARVAELCELLASHAAVTMRVTKEALRRLRPVPDGDDLVREAYGSEEFRSRVRVSQWRWPEVRRITGVVRVVSAGARHPRACWLHVTGCRVPADAGRARRNAADSGHLP